MRFYLDGKSSTELEEGVNIQKKKVAVMSVFLDGHATIEQLVFASPQASVEVVGWEWDSREEEKEMGSCEGIEVDDFTVRGPLSTYVLSENDNLGSILYSHVSLN